MGPRISSSAVIRHIVGSTMAERGRRYYAKGYVKQVVVDSDRDTHTVNALVDGTQFDPYQVDLTVTDSDEALRVDCFCTCPVTYDCKHAAAVLYWLMDHGPRLQEAAPTDDGDHSMPVSSEHGKLNLDAWLSTIEKIDNQSQSPNKLLPTEIAVNHISYILTPQDERVTVTFVVNTSRRADDVVNQSFTDPWSVLNEQDLLLTAEDSELLMALNQMNAVTAASHAVMMLPLSNDCGPLVQQMLASEQCYFQHHDKAHRLTLASARKGTFEWLPAEQGAQQLALRFPGDHLAGVQLLHCAPPFFLDADSLVCGPVITDLLPVDAATLCSLPPLSLEYASQVRQRLEKAGTLAAVPPPDAPQESVIDDVEPQPVLSLSWLAGLAPVDDTGRACAHGFNVDEVQFATTQLAFSYDGHLVDAFDEGSVRVVDGQSIRVYQRNTDVEQQALELLEQLPLLALSELPYLEAQRSVPTQSRFVAKSGSYQTMDPYQRIGDESDCAQFIRRAIPMLEEHGWLVRCDPSWPFLESPDIDDWFVDVDSSGADWFSVGMGMRINDETYDIAQPLADYISSLDEQSLLACEESAAAVESLLIEHPLVIELHNGQRAILPYEPLVTLFKALLALCGNKSTEFSLDGLFPIEAASLLHEATGINTNATIQWRGGEQVLALGRQLSAFESGEIPSIPPGFQADLRPYQLTGLAWFLALSRSGFGGVLADDMGLGKTVQTLAFLASVKTTCEVDKPTLIVAPTSVLGNWQRELKRFAPALQSLIWHGKDRFDNALMLPAMDVVITSFGLERRDLDSLAELEFRFLIIDEAQNIKNPQSAAHRALLSLQAEQRFALTGTPLENNLDELWSLFHMVVPGLLGSRTEFRKRYRTPIERQEDNERQRHLSRLIRPFMLRRTKEEVATDLPEKIIVDEMVTLTDKQATLYETIRVSADQRIRQALRDKGLASSQITILDALLKLRQVCCDPQLVSLKKAHKVTESAKRTRLMELLDTLIHEGRRILVFSQFVSMLELIARDLDAQSVNYQMLTGRSRRRDSIVDAFQTGKDPVFLISLKAGGAGLNLTAADTVIIYDPWWNPAAEAQAMDRSHRIGQTNTVFVYRLLADQTLETSIQDMQRRKAALARAVLDTGGAGSISLKESDLELLLAPMTTDRAKT